MENLIHSFKSFKKSVKHWWISLFVGILAVIVGVWCLASPDVTLISMTYVFSSMFLIGGIFDVVFALSNRKYMSGWGWTLTSGILEILLAILLFALPVPIVAGILIYLVGFWILFRSLWGIGESCALQMAGFRGWGWLLALSILSLCFSFFYLLSPVFGGIFVVVLVGTGIICYGIFRIVLSFKLREINKTLSKFNK